MNNGLHVILVLPDGETWTTIDGCSTLIITDEEFMALCDDHCSVSDLTPVAGVELVDMGNA